MWFVWRVSWVMRHTNSNLALTNFVITFFAAVFFFSFSLAYFSSFPTTSALVVLQAFFLPPLRFSLSFASQLLDSSEAGIVSGYCRIVRTIFLSPFPYFPYSFS